MQNKNFQKIIYIVFFIILSCKSNNEIDNNKQKNYQAIDMEIKSIKQDISNYETNPKENLKAKIIKKYSELTSKIAAANFREFFEKLTSKLSELLSDKKIKISDIKKVDLKYIITELEKTKKYINEISEINKSLFVKNQILDKNLLPSKDALNWSIYHPVSEDILKSLKEIKQRNKEEKIENKKIKDLIKNLEKNKNLDFSIENNRKKYTKILASGVFEIGFIMGVTGHKENLGYKTFKLKDLNIEYKNRINNFISFEKELEGLDKNISISKKNELDFKAHNILAELEILNFRIYKVKQYNKIKKLLKNKSIKIEEISKIEEFKNIKLSDINSYLDKINILLKNKKINHDFKREYQKNHIIKVEWPQYLQLRMEIINCLTKLVDRKKIKEKEFIDDSLDLSKIVSFEYNKEALDLLKKADNKIFSNIK